MRVDRNPAALSVFLHRHGPGAPTQRIVFLRRRQRFIGLPDGGGVDSPRIRAGRRHRASEI